MSLYKQDKNVPTIYTFTNYDMMMVFLEFI